MMYRCENCGHLFEDGEQAVWEEKHGLDTPPYEKWDGCPLCHEGYEEVYQCKECEKWYAKSELYDDWCEKCLCETINYDTFFEYCEANKEDNYLDVFVMQEFFDVKMPEHSSYDFHALMVWVYKERVAIANAYRNIFHEESHRDFLTSCKRFIMDDDDGYEREYYAEWLLQEKGVK